MSVANTVERSLDERGSSSALLVLGMHRSGTSAITGALGLCGAWVGEETELTGANAENPRGFWERRDMRQICDRLLQAAGADWWKVASFDAKAIPHAILAEERRRFEKIVSALDEHGTWVVKEPRLCLLLPLLRDHMDSPVCIHIFRNPLEVARSLQSRNGFSIAAGLALWEAYNRCALSASENLPRLLVSHESLMLRPVETTDGLVGRLDELAVSHLVRPNEDRLKQFINPSLYRRRATEEETDEYLAPSQRTLWQQFRSDQVFVHDGSASISRVTRQHLFDLESAEGSLNHQKDRENEQSAELTKRAAKIKARDETIEARDATINVHDETIRTLKSRTDELSAELRKRTATIEARDEAIEARDATINVHDETIRALKSRTDELSSELRKRTATIEARDEAIAARDATINVHDETIRTLKSRTDELSSELRKRTATIEARDEAIAARDATINVHDETIRTLKSRTDELSSELRKRTATIEARDEAIEARDATINVHDETIRALKSRTDELSSELRKRTATIEARDEAIEARDATIATRDATIAARDATINVHDETIRALKSRTDELSSELRKRTATIEARDATIRGLLESNSWRVTAPLRALSRSVRWIRRTLRRALKLLFWVATGQFSHAISAIRFVIKGSYQKLQPHRGGRQRTGADSLSKLSHRQAETSSRRIRTTVPARPVGDKPKPKVSVIVWDVGHNPLGRAYLLADVLRNDYDVELIGANFPRFGNEIWKPLRNFSRVVIKRFPGGNFPEHFKTMEDIAEQIEGDVIYVSKPRLPSLELAILAKLHRNRPVILDIDDYELGFFGNREPLSLEGVRARRSAMDFDCPHDEVWTQYGESLIPLFEQITVSNEELRQKYGGIVLPHIRDEADFDPNAYPRHAIRRNLGFTPDDKVVLFVGTPRMHKGIAQLAAALKELNRPDYKLLIVGSPADGGVQQIFHDVDPSRVKLVPDVPFCDLPGYLCAGDLVCLLQDEREASSAFQMPAKFTDALSMGIPVLASNVPPLLNVARRELVELLGDTPPARKIDEIFSDYAVYKKRATWNRQIYLKEYSYGANLGKLKEIIDRLAGNPNPIPPAFRDLVDYHRGIFAPASDLPRTIPKIIAPSTPKRGQSTVEAAAARARIARDRRRDGGAYADDKLDIIFFWKQNDTGIYGRRQEMLVKYLAKDPRVNRIFHFDAPINFVRSARTATKSAPTGRDSHFRLVLRQILRRKLGRANTDRVRFDTFTFLTKRRVPGVLKHVLPSEGEYLDYLERRFRRFDVGRRRTIFWVCPNDFYFPAIEERFDPDLVVSDVIDDQRKWEISQEYSVALSRNYEEILARSDLVFVNCRSVFNSMSAFSDNIHMLPNAVELLEEEARHWPKPRELERLRGPIVGYVGNLDIARLDLELLKALASRRPDWSLVFIGSMHRGGEIRELEKYGNVHFLGVRVYEQAVRYIRHFDVAIIPHLDNELTRSMNPLKLYVYQSLYVPVVSTPIANIGDFSEFMQIGRTPEEFIERIDDCLRRDPVYDDLPRMRELLKRNSWPERAKHVLELVDQEFSNRKKTPSALDHVGHLDEMSGYTGRCTVCGQLGHFSRAEDIASIRENFSCATCRSSLRYREQARLILAYFSREDSGSLANLVNEAEFQKLEIYEPGLIGPFRKFLQELPRYHTSYFWSGVERGEYQKGIQCQDLMDLTYEDDTFDLVITSDIFEYVRKPYLGLREVNRVLKPGGFHIFSIPVQHPMPARTVFRVDTSGPEDVFVLPEHYHSAPFGGRSLVYTDFGRDVTETMAADGIDLEMVSPCTVGYPDYIASRLLTFFWKKRNFRQMECGPSIDSYRVEKGG